MCDKVYQENVMDNYIRPPCAQQAYTTAYSYTVMSREGYNIQGLNMCDYMYGSQTGNRNQTAYTTPAQFYNQDQLDWLPDSVERTTNVDICNKDLSPAGFCSSNVDMHLSDYYKKDASHGYCTMNQKYVEYPSCSQMNFCNNFMSTEQTLDTTLNGFYESKLQDNHYEHFYQPNLTFTDVNNAESAVDGSNDGSDIVVEESDEEVTDYSEDLEKRYDYTTNCIICNVIYTPIGSQFYMLTQATPLTMSSQQPVIQKLSEMLGTLNSKRNYLCSNCLSLINAIDHLQLKLESAKIDMLTKYKKTCKDNNLADLTFNRNNSRIKFKSFCGLHSFKCKYCKKLFTFKKLYESHVFRHKMANRFLCELCGRRFSKFSLFKSHLKWHSGFKKPKMILAFVCKICNKSFRTRTNLNEHTNHCSGNLPNECKQCDKKFATATKLKNHTKLKHDKKFVAICSICNVGFVKLSDYKSHKLTHSPEKKFHCTKCEKSYKTISNLNYHMKYHNDSLPFICKICTRGFMRKDYLESHMNNHKGIKNFSCQLCDKKFVSQKNLDAHIKYHEGTVKKKTCTICNKEITNGFEEHLRMHGKLLEFKCNICEMKFNTKGAMAKHVKRKHHSSES